MARTETPLVRNFLEIKVLKQDVDYDIHKYTTTSSAEAYRFYIQGVNLFSGDNYSFLDTRGWGLYKQGRLEEALKVLNDSWDLRPLYDHEGYQHIQEVEQALASQNK